jgi:homoserine dehydrogenase
MTCKIALVGCGNVGTALLEVLYEKKTELFEKYGLDYRVTMISDLMKGTAVDPNGLDLGLVLENLHSKNSLADLPQDNGSFEEILDKSRATILAEATPTDLKTGEPGLSHVRAALSRGISVTTTNKGPIALAWDELHNTAEECGAELRYEGVVMSGTPLINLLNNGIAGASVTKVEGILNGTTNFILTKMAEGAEFSEALEEAQRLGYAEADPSGDIEGWDAAVKVSILSRIIFGEEVPPSKVDRVGITGITAQKIKDAAAASCSVKFIASIEKCDSGLKCAAKPVEVPLSHPLADVNGATNAVTVTTDNLGDVTLIGPGAGRRETGQALLVDILDIVRSKKTRVK